MTDSSKSERIATPPPAARRAGRSPWLAIHEASALVGVSEATLRRWAEAGDVEAFVTPGGHRRFTRAGLAKLLPHVPRAPRTLRQLGETPERVVRNYRRDLGSTTGSGWLSELDEAERATFREPGHRILLAVLGYLDASDDAIAAARLEEARAAAADYGRLAAARGLHAAVAAEAYLRFRAPFLEDLAAVARRRRLDASEATGLVDAAVRVFDRLLVALLEAQAEATAAAATSASAASPVETTVEA